MNYRRTGHWRLAEVVLKSTTLTPIHAHTVDGKHSVSMPAEAA
jgi:hypothetical protein